MRPGLSPPQPPPPSTQISYPTPTPTPPAPGVRLSSQGQIKSLCNLHSHSIKSSPLRPLRNSCRDSALSVLLSCCREGRGSSPAGALHPRPPPHPAPSHPTLPYPTLPDTHRQTFRQREGAASQKIASERLHERRCPCFIVPLSPRHNKAQLQKKIAQRGQQASEKGK